MPGFNVSGVGDGPSSNIEPFYTYTWEIISLMGEGVRPGSPNAENVLVYPKDCKLPSFSAQPQRVKGASLVYKYASEINWDDAKVTYYDVPTSSSSRLVDILKKWRLRVWDPQRGLGVADSDDIGSASATKQEGYKKTSEIRVFNGPNTIEYSWQMFGCWPSTIREGELTYTNSDVKVVEVTITYDWAESGDVGQNHTASTGAFAGSP